MGQEQDTLENELRLQIDGLFGERFREVGSGIQKIISDIRGIVASIEEKEQHLPAMRKDLADAQWYLGEEKQKVLHLAVQFQALEKACQGKDECMRRLQDELQQQRRQREESEWYRGEEKSSRQALENKLQDCLRYIQHLEEDNRRLKAQWEESQWYLQEERARKPIAV